MFPRKYWKLKLSIRAQNITMFWTLFFKWNSRLFNRVSKCANRILCNVPSFWTFFDEKAFKMADFNHQSAKIHRTKVYESISEVLDSFMSPLNVQKNKVGDGLFSRQISIKSTVDKVTILYTVRTECYNCLHFQHFYTDYFWLVGKTCILTEINNLDSWLG